MTEYTMEQQKANRKLWVEALRSGGFRQATKVLKTANGSMCCLGVLAHLAGCDWKWSDYHGEFKADDTAGVCPERGMEFVGLARPHGDFREAGKDTFLAKVNDGGATFDEIADIIESEPPGLFVESVQS